MEGTLVVVSKVSWATATSKIHLSEDGVPDSDGILGVARYKVRLHVTIPDEILVRDLALTLGMVHKFVGKLPKHAARHFFQEHLKAPCSCHVLLCKIECIFRRNSQRDTAFECEAKEPSVSKSVNIHWPWGGGTFSHGLEF